MTRIKSPISRVGIIEPDGILNGSTIVTRIPNAIAKMNPSVLKKVTTSPQVLWEDCAFELVSFEPPSAAAFCDIV
jgi:hypothetical protein